MFATVFAGVVPACSGSQQDESHRGVAAQGFSSPAPTAGSSSDSADAAAPTVQSQTIVLAYVAFDSGASAGEPDATAGDDAAIAAPTDAGHPHGRRGSTHR